MSGESSHQWHQRDSHSDADLERRTNDLLHKAESISMELRLQTERLAATIDLFSRDVVDPLRAMTRDEHSD